MVFGAETHLGGGVMSTFVFCQLLEHPAFAVCWQYSSQERPTWIILITLPQLPSYTGAYMPKLTLMVK